MDARHSTSPSIRRKAEEPADLAEVPAEAVLEAVPAQALEALVLPVEVLQVLLAEVQVSVLPVAAEVPAGLVSVAAATRLELRVEAAVRPFRA